MFFYTKTVYDPNEMKLLSKRTPNNPTINHSKNIKLVPSIKCSKTITSPTPLSIK